MLFIAAEASKAITMTSENGDHEAPEEEDGLTQIMNNYSSSESEPESDSDQSDSSTNADEEEEEYLLLELSDLRLEFQCAICLGIIRNTRTVMECLHRFCRECIDKSMRLGNKQCPTCRTHCASRRSLRDDPNFDALIATLYPDPDMYDQEEWDLHEDDIAHNNKQIQASIAETRERQAKALGKKQRSQRNFRNAGHPSVSNGNENMNENDWGNDSTSVGEQEVSTEISGSSTLAWGENAEQSHPQVGGDSPISRRLTTLIDDLQDLSENNEEGLPVSLKLVSLDEQSIPSFEPPYIVCENRSMKVKTLCEFVALKTALEVDEVELLLVLQPENSIFEGERTIDAEKDVLRLLDEEETMSELMSGDDNTVSGHLIMAYKKK